MSGMLIIVNLQLRKIRGLNVVDQLKQEMRKGSVWMWEIGNIVGKLLASRCKASTKGFPSVQVYREAM